MARIGSPGPRPRHRPTDPITTTTKTMAETLTITDNRTGKQYQLPITDGTIRANDLKKIKVDEEDGGLATYDPAFMNTAACRSRITYIDGDKGILLYRGYPIEQLAEHSTYLETAYLILFGELPTPKQLSEWTQRRPHGVPGETGRVDVDRVRGIARPDIDPRSRVSLADR